MKQPVQTDDFSHAPTPERRAFQMHVNLLKDVISRQAGTLDKGALEGVMNLIEAGATKGVITLTPSRLVITDDGRGFQTRNEVLAAFEMFGKSDERKQEDKRYAQFQMGRGQLMAMGKTRYRTRTFSMDVDILNETNPGYELTEHLSDEPGCVVTVDLYDPLDVFELNEISKKVCRAVRYVDVPIFLNGKQVNEDPASLKWSADTDFAYYRFSQSTSKLEIYNLGVYVGAAHDLGIGGTVISKKQLTLNFARNEVIRSCETWKTIRKEFKQRTTKSLLDKKSFSAEDAATVLSMIFNAEIPYYQAASLKILRDTNYKPRCFRDLDNKRVAFDQRASVKAEKAMQINPFALILDRDYTYALLDATDNDVARLLLDAARYASHSPRDKSRLPQIVPVEELYVDLNDDKQIVDEGGIEKVYRTALDVMRDCEHTARLVYGTTPEYQAHSFAKRHIKLGKSDTVTTWTDGRTYIVLDFERFRKCVWSVAGWTQVMLMLVDMYAYTSDDRTREPDYYERYHDYVPAFAGQAGSAFRAFTKAAVAKHPDAAKRLRAEALAQAMLEEDALETDDLKGSAADNEPPNDWAT